MIEEIRTYLENKAEAYDFKKIKEMANHISNDYLSHHGEGSLVKDEIGVLTYALFRMPATYQVVKEVIKELPTNINNVLDVGSGMGVASFALHEDKPHLSFTCLEKEQAMITLGEELVNQFLNDQKINFINADYSIYLPNEQFDLVIASYSLNELEEDKRIDVIDKLWNLTNKYLVIIEPGTMIGAKEIKTIREHLLTKNAFVLAPCTHQEVCPIKENDWCHFATRVMRSKMHKLLKNADVPYEDEKYSYIVFSKEAINKVETKRILRHPLIGGNVIKITSCSKEGIKEESVTRSNKELFKLAKKKKWGETL